MWGLLNQFSMFSYFRNNQNSGYLYKIMSTFDKCHRSSAAATPAKYEHDLKYLAYILAKSKFLIIEKLMSRALVTPTHPWPHLSCGGRLLLDSLEPLIPMLGWPLTGLAWPTWRRHSPNQAIPPTQAAAGHWYQYKDYLSWCRDFQHKDKVVTTSCRGPFWTM